MKRSIVVILFFISLFFASCLDNQSSNNEKLLQELDETIQNRKVISQEKERQIHVLKQISYGIGSPKERYEINNRIIQEYLWHNADSAKVYLNKNRKIASDLQNQKLIDENNLQYSTLLSTSGLLNESLNMLDKVSRKTLDSSLLRQYYYAQEWFNYVSSQFSDDQQYLSVYKNKELTYADSVKNTYSPASLEYLRYDSYILYEKGKTKEAKEILISTIPKFKKDTRYSAMINYDLAGVYKRENNIRLYEEYLIKAAIIDLKISSKENAAIKDLAVSLYTRNPNEIYRANKYIRIALEDASFFNNRQRILQIAEKLPLIVNTYQNKSIEENRHLKILIFIISILFIFIIGMLFFIFKQMKLLKKTRKELSVFNTELAQSNQQLQNTNKQLHTANEQLRIVNEKLHVANETREENVGIFMDLSSSYIHKLEDYKETVRRKILSNSTNDLLKVGENTQLLTKYEKNDFFKNFDKAVLNLFPDFIGHFNQLLKEEHKIQLKKGELLNTELRIFALIRLGITDSSKIASFLHYSPQTIYNYRTKVKNGAICKRGNFEEQIMEIGVK